MRARTMAAALAAAALCWTVAAQDARPLIEVYRRATTWEDRRVALEQIVASGAAAPAGFYGGALEEALTAREARIVVREESARTQVRLVLAQQLGLARAKDSAPTLYRLFVEERDLTVRGAALEALGRVGSLEHLGLMADTLSQLSSSPRGPAGEVLAAGAIGGLEALGDPAGYAPVFYASFGSGSGALRSRAAQALERIATDPTDLLAAIVSRDASLRVRFEALSAQVASRATADKKIATALGALRELSGKKLESQEERGLATRMRALAVSALIDNKMRSDDALPALEALQREEPDMGVKLAAVAAVGAVGSERAAGLLRASLKTLNDRQQLGDRLDDRVVRATIRALGATGKASARSELFRVKFAGYASGIVREAERALEQIP